MSQINQDIAALKAKYGSMKGIPTADQIMRVVAELEKRIVFCDGCMKRVTCPVWK